VVPEFSIATRNLADVNVVALHGELDIVSVDGLPDTLAAVAGFSSRSICPVSASWIPAASPPLRKQGIGSWRTENHIGHCSADADPDSPPVIQRWTTPGSFD
jgi:hypothetical protein